MVVIDYTPMRVPRALQPMQPEQLSSNNKEKFGWCLYDWANSAFATTILAAILPVYFAEYVVPKQGVDLSFMGFTGCLSATSLWGYASGLTSLLILFSAPLLGGIADQGRKKKSLLMIFCYLGSLFTVLLFFSGPGDVFYILILFCLAQYFFVGGNVFYDAFLPLITKGKDMDQLSGQGYALGYLGGGLLLAISVLFIQFSHVFGIHKETAVRLSLASAGLWWALFGTISFLLFQEEKTPGEVQKSIRQAALEGLRKTWETTRAFTRHRQVLIFLVAFMLYNDGVQTVIRMASIYGKDELNLPTGTLLGTLLMVQFIGIGGAILMSRVARPFGTKRTIMGLLVIWFALTIFAYKMNTSLEFWIMGVVVGLILGGTQALSRSFYGRLIPEGQSAQFFGYFSVFSKLSAIWGPILFAFIRQATGTSRFSVLAVSVFFVVGWLILFFVEEGKNDSVGSN